MTPRQSNLPMLALFVGVVILVATISAQANGGSYTSGQAATTTPSSTNPSISASP